MKGFRQPNKQEQLKAVATELNNTQTAASITQRMVQQLMINMKRMSDDMGNAFNQLYELQYKYIALQKALNVDVVTLDKIANEQRLIDFNSGVANENTKEGLVFSNVVTDNSVITITSLAKDNTGKDCGIFRSRLKLAECGVPELIRALTGQQVGVKVVVKLNSVDHEVELLSISDPEPPAATQVVDVPNLQVV